VTAIQGPNRESMKISCTQCWNSASRGQDASISAAAGKQQHASADVTNGYDPTYASVSDSRNNSYLGRGISLVKYVGSRGKSGTSDANAEFLNRVIRLFNEKEIPWQTGEMGKVDAGGGGTIAKFLAHLGMEVLDCGVPVLSMHSPFEITSKVDVYMTFQAYREFMANI
jgi:aspartyl aminopeptidase